MWLRPAAPNGVITMYQALLGSEVIINSSATQVVLSGLIFATSYNISVVALTVKGRGQPTYLEANTASIRESIILLLTNGQLSHCVCSSIS